MTINVKVAGSYSSTNNIFVKKGGAYSAVSDVLVKIAGQYVSVNGGGAFDPISLFAAGEQGVWYDPSDLTTLFQDSAGTTPVTAVEQPVGLMKDKSGRGNHAFQSTSAARPLLSARYNLLTNTEALTSSAWTFNGSARTANYGIAPDGTQTSTRLQFNGANQDIRQNATVNAVGVANIWVKGTAGETIFFSNNLTDSVSNITLTGAWQLLSRNGPTSNAILLMIGTWLGATARDIEVWHPDLRQSNDGVGLPSYQRVGNVSVTASDYDTTGFPLYIKPNGSSQYMVTNSINFSATDKMTVWAGLRDTNTALTSIVELSAVSNSTNGSFVLYGRVNVNGDYAFGMNTGATFGYRYTGAPAAFPITEVVSESLSGNGNISTGILPRINGSSPSLTNSGTIGTGNFGTYPLYLFARGGTSLWYGGRFTGLIVRGAQSTAQQIADGEAYLNSKTKAY